MVTYIKCLRGNLQGNHLRRCVAYPPSNLLADDDLEFYRHSASFIKAFKGFELDQVGFFGDDGDRFHTQFLPSD